MIQFKEMLDAAGVVHKNNALYEPVGPQDLRQRGKRHVKTLKKEVGFQYWQRIGRPAKEHVSYEEDKKRRAEFAKARNAAWKAVTGQSFEKYVRNSIRVNLGRRSPTECEIYTKLRYTNTLPHVWVGLEKRWLESPNATILAIKCGVDLRKDDAFALAKQDFTKGEWKWLLQQKQWMLLACSHNVLKKAATHRVRPTMVKNRFFRAASILPSRAFAVVYNDFQGVIKHWSPFPMMRHGQADMCREVHIIRDYVRANPDWRQTTLGTLFRAAEEWHTEINRRPYRHTQVKEQFPEIGQPLQLEDYSLQPIHQYALLQEEGKLMHHCVGVYGPACSEGTYHVARIEGKERATVGYRWNGDKWEMEQCYSYCNAYTTEDTIRAAKAYENQLNTRKYNELRAA